MSNRHLARTLALQALFEWDFQGKPVGRLVDILQYAFREFAPDFNDQGFAKSILEGVEKHLTEIDQLITKYAPEWPLEQITAVDRNVLRIGIYELKFAPDIPPKVAINEAIELAKTFGSDSSGKFVNGVLGSIYKVMEKKGEKQGMDKAPMGPRQYSAGGVVWHQDEKGVKVALILDGHGRWTFSKGKIDPNEDVEAAVKREINEEIGLSRLEVGEKLGEMELVVREPNSLPYPKTVYMYLVEAKDDNLKPAEHTGELKDARWFAYDDVEQALGYDQAKQIWQQAQKKLQPLINSK